MASNGPANVLLTNDWILWMFLLSKPPCSAFTILAGYGTAGSMKEEVKLEGAILSVKYFSNKILEITLCFLYTHRSNNISMEMVNNSK